MSCSYEMFGFVQYYSTTVVDPCGIVLNLMCVVFLGQIVSYRSNNNQANSRHSTGHMFKYLLIKASCELFYFTNDIFYLFYASQWRTLPFNIWLIYIRNDCEPIAFMLSSLMEVLATLGIC
jgi:hypothetical protein